MALHLNVICDVCEPPATLQAVKFNALEVHLMALITLFQSRGWTVLFDSQGMPRQWKCPQHTFPGPDTTTP